MAFTRKFLSAMGIEAEKIDEIINAHVEVVNSLKEERDDYKKDAETLADVQKQLNAANEKLAKNGDGETVLKKDFETLKKEYDDYKATVVEKETLTAKETAYRELLRAAGVSEKRHGAIIKLTDLKSIELDKDGKIKDAEKRTEDIKSEWSDFVEHTTTKGAQTATPPANNGGGKTTKADIYKKDENGRYVLSASERQKALAENPNLLT
jgi:hypothetical protein